MVPVPFKLFHEYNRIKRLNLILYLKYTKDPLCPNNKFNKQVKAFIVQKSLDNNSTSYTNITNDYHRYKLKKRKPFKIKSHYCYIQNIVKQICKINATIKNL